MNPNPFFSPENIRRIRFAFYEDQRTKQKEQDLQILSDLDEHKEHIRNGLVQKETTLLPIRSNYLPLEKTYNRALICS